MSKIARPGSEGNMRLLKEYGGGSTPPRQAYATGGAVNPSLDEGLSAAGDAGMKSDKPGKGKEKKDSKISINVIVAGKDKDAPPMPVPTGAAGLAPPPPPAPMPPMGAAPGGPPPGMMPGPGMPMRAKGGRVTHDDAPADKKVAAKAVHKHESGMHPGKPQTKFASGGKVPTKDSMLSEGGFQGGGGGAIGRLEKKKAYGK